MFLKLFGPTPGSFSLLSSSEYVSHMHNRCALTNTGCGFKSRKKWKNLFRREYLLSDKSYRKAKDIFGKLLHSGFQNYAQLCCGTNRSIVSRTNVNVGEAKKAPHKSTKNSGEQGLYSKILYKVVGCSPSNILPIVRGWPRQRQASQMKISLADPLNFGHTDLFSLKLSRIWLWPLQLFNG